MVFTVCYPPLVPRRPTMSIGSPLPLMQFRAPQDCPRATCVAWSAPAARVRRRPASSVPTILPARGAPSKPLQCLTVCLYTKPAERSCPMSIAFAAHCTGREARRRDRPLPHPPCPRMTRTTTTPSSSCSSPPTQWCAQHCKANLRQVSSLRVCVCVCACVCVCVCVCVYCVVYVYDNLNAHSA
jgi:hypothetical protein